MKRREQSEPPTVNRRRFCGAAAATVAASTLGFLSFPVGKKAKAEVAEQTVGDVSAISPFHVNVPEVELTELRRRINATRWPDRETVTNDSQGVQLATIQLLAHYWGTDYDWRKCEAKLNALPQFITQIDGLEIYFIHVQSPHQNALPLIVTHGWPGSVIEQLKIIDPLTNPTAHGGSSSDAFHLVIPSMPGYGFSGKPITIGWDPAHIARAWVVLMQRLGYARFVAQGGDWGAAVSNLMAEQAPPELLGIHTNFPAAVSPAIGKSLACGNPPPPDLSAEEKVAYEQLQDFKARRSAYAAEMGTRPQTLYEIVDSPVALAAWMLDGHPYSDLSQDDLLDNITLYWVTNTAISSARLYWEYKARSILSAVNVSIPTAVSIFPGEVYEAPRSWVELAYHKLIYYHRVNAGGHFAAWEQPQLFAEEVRAGFRPLREGLTG